MRSWGLLGLLRGFGWFGILGFLGTPPRGFPNFIEGIGGINKFWNYRLYASSAKTIFDGMPREAKFFNHVGNGDAFNSHYFIIGVF
jgi:hypothetical protein